ncbi:hypothetical protein DSM112329_04204 [Paraconexibacter sp. AEG42_29]|uniref:Acyl dehydratase n=1 Tax=Paraconexibacter sp. AEG42_29 TaxID=2997339 RepID=A0AAU7B0A7_9ACTN
MVGRELGVSSWAEVSAGLQAATDPAFAPLLLGPVLKAQVVRFAGWRSSLNYGYEDLRFGVPVPVGGLLRLRLQLAALHDRGSSLEIVLRQTFEAAGVAEPACTGCWRLRLVP